MADSQKKTCRANMQTIANAVQAGRVKNNAADYSTFVGSVTTTLEPDLQSRSYLPQWRRLYYRQRKQRELFDLPG